MYCIFFFSKLSFLCVYQLNKKTKAIIWAIIILKVRVFCVELIVL